MFRWKNFMNFILLSLPPVFVFSFLFFLFRLLTLLRFRSLWIFAQFSGFSLQFASAIVISTSTHSLVQIDGLRDLIDTALWGAHETPANVIRQSNNEEDRGHEFLIAIGSCLFFVGLIGLGGAYMENRHLLSIVSFFTSLNSNYNLARRLVINAEKIVFGNFSRSLGLGDTEMFLKSNTRRVPVTLTNWDTCFEFFYKLVLFGELLCTAGSWKHLQLHVYWMIVWGL